MKIINCHKPEIKVKFNFTNHQPVDNTSIDFMEESRMLCNLDNKISNEVFMKNVLGISKSLK